MKKKVSNPTNSAIPNIVSSHSSMQSSLHPPSQATSMSGSSACAAPAAEISTKPKSKNKKKKKKKNKHKMQLSPTPNSMANQQQMDITAPDTTIFCAHRHHQGTDIPLSSESSQQHTRVPPSHPPPALPGALSHAYHQTSSTSLNGITSNKQQSSQHNDNSTTLSTKKNADKDAFWSSSMNKAEERQKIREFLLQLGEDERRSLVKVEKEAVLRKMMKQQKYSCNCSVCGKKRMAIEDELEVLYGAYYEELEQYANHQQHHGQQILRGFQAHSGMEGSQCGNCMDDQNDDGMYSLDDNDGDEEHDDPLEEHTFEGGHGSDVSDDDFSYSHEDDLQHSAANKMARKANTRSGDHFSFGNSLPVKGGILTVADDILKNDGKKYLSMMERLAERRMQRNDEVHLNPDVSYNDDDDDDDDDDDGDFYEDENEEDTRTEEQRLEEGRRMFQVFAARRFEQRVLDAYREKVAKERQQRLLQELEEEDQQRQERELKKQRDKERKKDRKRQLKQQQEQERLAKEAQRQAEEAKKRAEQQEKINAERQKRERERQQKIEERRIKDEERRRKEEAKRQRIKEERERAMEKERRQKEEEERDRREKEFLKEKARKEKELKDELARRDRELKEQIILHNRQIMERANSSEIVTTTKLDDSVSQSVPSSQSTPIPATVAPLSASISVSQPDSSSLPSIFRPAKSIQTNSDPPKQQLSTDILINVARQPHPVPSSDLLQPKLFPPPQQPFLDILQPSPPVFGPPPLDDTVPSLGTLQQYHHQPPIPTPIGVPLSALNVSCSGPSVSSFHHAMEPSLSSHGRSPLRGLAQLHISNSSQSSTITTSSPLTTSPNTVTSPSISIPTNHARRSSAVAGPIGSPVSHRCNGLVSVSGSGHEMNGALGTGSHLASSNADGSPDYSFFSNFLFGESNKGAASTTATPPPPPSVIDTDLTVSSQSKLNKSLDREGRFSADSPNLEWKNGWSATSLLAENIHGNLFGDALIERRLLLLDRAKTAYRKLDEITQTNSFVVGSTASSHTLIQLHRMMNDLYCDTQVDLRELDDILNHSSQVEFQCIHHPQHGLLVSYDPGSTSAANATLASMATTPTKQTVNDPLILQRSSVLPHNPVSPTSSFPSYSLPGSHSSSFSYSTNTTAPSHLNLNPPPPPLLPSQQQYCPFPATSSLIPAHLSPSTFTYPDTSFSHTGQDNAS